MRLKIEADVEKLLNEILDFQVANRGTEHARYNCYTIQSKRVGGKWVYAMPPWVGKAERLLRQVKR